MLRKIVYVALVAAVIGGSYGYYLWNKPIQKTSNKKADVTVAAADMAAQYSDALYLGKIVEVKGTVSNIETANGISNITFETAEPMVAVSCEMEKGSENPNIKVGDEATFRGQCDGKLSDVVLTRCILIKK